MASDLSTVNYLISQIANAGEVSARKMFREYGVYCNGKLVALICDNQLFVKPTKGGRTFSGDFEEAAPYMGAKPSFLISDKHWADRQWMTELIKLTASDLSLS